LSNRWLVFGPTLPDPALRLFCFHHAGAGASVYRLWSLEAPPGIDVCAVQLPGRELRVREPLPTGLTQTVSELADALAEELRPPFALFGHSLGARLAFELTRELRRRGRPLPLRLGLSARRAPHLPRRIPLVSRASEPDLIAYLKSTGGLPEAILREPEFLAMILPVIRADLELAEAPFEPGEPLPVPISAFCGRDDMLVDVPEAEAWREHGTSSFRFHSFPGDHFFPARLRAEVTRALYDDISADAR